MSTAATQPGIEAEVLELAAALDTAFDAGDLDAVAGFWSDDIAYTAPGLALRGRTQRRKAERATLDAFPGGWLERTGCWVSPAGEGPGSATVTFVGVLHGRHAGVWRTPDGDVPPTGSTVALPYISIVTWRGGLIVEQRMSYDRLDLLRQLGLLPAPAQPSAAVSPDRERTSSTPASAPAAAGTRA